MYRARISGEIVAGISRDIPTRLFKRHSRKVPEGIAVELRTNISCKKY